MRHLRHKRPDQDLLIPRRTGYRALGTVVTVLLLATVFVMAYAVATIIWLAGLPVLATALEAGALFAVTMGLILALASLAGAAFMGIGAVRTLSRLLPLGVSSIPPRTRTALVALSVVGILVFAVFFGQLAADLRRGTPTDDTLFVWPVIATLVVFVATLLIVRSQHHRAAAGRDGPFVLFLRRFSSYSDRVVLGECLKACPRAVPLMLLVPSVARIRDWNPVSLAFSGIRVRSAFRSLPNFYRAEDAEWETTARELIARADRIVFDVSDGSSSITLEAAMVTDADRWPHVVALVEERTGDTPDDLTTRAGTTVRYRRRWRIRQLLLGFLVSGTTTGGVMTLVDTLGVPGVAIPPIGFATWALIFAVFFLRPGMDAEGSRDLRAALGAPPPAARTLPVVAAKSTCLPADAGST